MDLYGRVPSPPAPPKKGVQFSKRTRVADGRTPGALAGGKDVADTAEKQKGTCGKFGKTNGASTQRPGDQLAVKMEAPRMSAIEGKADINRYGSKGPLIAKSGHSKHFRGYAASIHRVLLGVPGPDRLGACFHPFRLVATTDCTQQCGVVQ